MSWSFPTNSVRVRNLCSIDKTLTWNSKKNISVSSCWIDRQSLLERWFVDGIVEWNVRQKCSFVLTCTDFALHSKNVKIKNKGSLSFGKKKSSSDFQFQWKANQLILQTISCGKTEASLWRRTERETEFWIFAIGTEAVASTII